MTREKGDVKSVISISAAIGTLVVVLVIGVALYLQEVRHRAAVQPRDVFAELQFVKGEMKQYGIDMRQQGKELNAEIVKLRESVNHSKEIAAEVKKETDALAKSLNAELVALKKELMELNGKK